MSTIIPVYGIQGCFQKLPQETIDDKSRNQWQEFGLFPEWVDTFPDCVKFLLESKLIYTIIGFHNTCRNDLLDGLQIGRDGHPLIKVEGDLRRWERVKEMISYDSEGEQIKSKGYSGNIANIWNYFHLHGLIRQDRFYYDQPFPVFKLSTEELLQLQDHARRFYETHDEVELGVKKECVLQFFTSPRKDGLLAHPLLENFSQQYPMHISIRLITADGYVYSFGYHEQRQIIDDIASTLLKTGNARIAMLDYEEFRKHSGRYVTSIPITSKNAEGILNRVAQLNQQQLRFNYARQNCSALVNEVMAFTGYEVDLRTTAKTALWATVPSLSQLPYIGHLIAAVQGVIERIWNTILDCIPACVLSLFSWADYVVFALPRKCQTIAANLFLWKIGATTMTGPLDSGVEEDFSRPDGTIQSFSTLFRSWTDFFKDDHDVFQPAYFIRWQKRQHSTTYHAPRHRPRLEGLLEFPLLPSEA